MRPVAFLLLALAGAQTDVRALLRSGGVPDHARDTPAVLAALKDPEALIRRRAAGALGAMDLATERAERQSRMRATKEDAARRQKAVDALAAAAHDPDARVRMEAVRSLLVLLRNRDFWGHGEPLDDPQKLRPLIALGPAIVPILTDELRTNDENRYAIRFAAVRTLAAMRGPRVLDALLLAIYREAGSFLLWEAMRAAIRYDDPRVIPALIANLGKGIGDYGGTPGIWALKRLRDRGVPPILRALATSRERRVRWLLVQAFGERPDPRARPALIAALRDEDEGIAERAAEALAAYPHPATVAALVSAASHRTLWIREFALDSLGTLRAASAEATIVRALRDPQSRIRGSAVGALVAIRGRAAVPRLLPLFGDVPLRGALASAVRPLLDPRLIPGLMSILRGPGEVGVGDAGLVLAAMDVREAIPLLIERMRRGGGYTEAQALFAFGTPAAAPLLAFFPNSGEAEGDVVRALGGTHDPQAVDLLLTLLDDPRLSDDAVDALGQLGDRRAIAPLVARLSTERRFHAIRVLGRLRAVEAVEPLIPLLGRSDELSGYVADALARIGDPRALEPLLAFLARDRGIRAMALENMASFHDSRLFALLVRDLGSDNPYDAQAAARALGRYGDPKALPTLRRAAKSDDEKLAKAARESISLLSRKTAGQKP